MEVKFPSGWVPKWVEKGIETGTIGSMPLHGIQVMNEQDSMNGFPQGSGIRARGLRASASILAAAGLLVLGAEGAPSNFVDGLGGSVDAESSAPQEGDESPRDAMLRSLRRVEDRDLSPRQRSGAVDEVLSFGTEGARRLVDALIDEVEDRSKADRKTRNKVLSDLERLADRVESSRASREREREVESLRVTVLKHARDGGLTKETVVSVSDPALARLFVLLDLEPEHLGEDGDEVFDRIDDLSARFEDATAVYQLLTHGRDALISTAEGERLAKRRPLPRDPSSEARRLEQAVERILFFATVPEKSDRTVIEANAELASSLGERVNEGFHPDGSTHREPSIDGLGRAELEALVPGELEGVIELNRIRVRLGLRALRMDVKLNEASRGHSRDMRVHDFFSHTSPLPGKSSFGDRARAAGTGASGENIAVGQQTGKGVIGSWWHSPGHHRNMLGNHARIGLGRSGHYWTQLFGG